MSEERLIRGLHPYIAQRMQLERLRKFDLTRLPSSDEEVYLFQAVARENPSDDRLVAFAQVRDLTELREHDGRLVALPTAEDTIADLPRLDPPRAVAAAVEEALQHQPDRHLRLAAESTITRAEMEMIAGRVLPTTAGAGLEEILFIARQRDRHDRRADQGRRADHLRRHRRHRADHRRRRRRSRSSRWTATGRRCCARAAATPSTRTS